ncbi:interferon lambda receptor 1-like [Heptranchias perlo]|uniref:interferon lambda receptor 1-like n=1 Tax=Heptranchias perlo TaxID=212740 RepID=UPI003559E015
MASLWCILSYVLIQQVLGNISVPSQNVILNSKNFSLFLTWTPSEELPPETLYEMIITPKANWLPLRNCAEGCDITCIIEKCYTYYQAKVRSILPGLPVVWSKSNRFMPFSDVELGAPQVKVVLGEESVTVQLQIKLTTCKTKVFKACLLENLSYEVEFWDADERVKRPMKRNLTNNTMEIQKSELRGSNNCIAARSVHKTSAKRSNFSEPVCFNLKQKELQTGEYVAIVGTMLGLLFLILIAVAIVKKIICVPSEVKIPATLDFTKNIIFTQMMANIQPDVCKLSIIIHCEQNIAPERNLLKEEIETKQVNVLDNTDFTDESDEEDECCNYTDNWWIPDGVFFDKGETFANIQHQTPKAETYQKVNCSSVSSIGAIDIQSQNPDCIEHNRLQTKSYDDVCNPSSLTSIVLNSNNFSDHITSVVQEHEEKDRNGDIPLSSVQILCCDGDEDDLLSDDVQLLDCD